MSDTHPDALVFFGAAGDLAHKKIFPALQAMAKRGRLGVPVVGVAKSGWDLDWFRARARDSVEAHGGLDPAAFDTLCRLLRYVDEDYEDPATFQTLRKELGAARRPVFYLAIPPALFGLVVGQLARSGWRKGACVNLEKPFGRDLASARGLNRVLLGSFDEPAIFRIDHYLGKRPVQNLVLFRFVNSLLEPFWNCNHVESVQVTMAEAFGVQGRGAFYDGIGAVRDVIQNHLFQVIANLAIEPPFRSNSESFRDEKVKVLKAIAPLNAEDVVRGQFVGYREEPGVAPHSTVETFAALRLMVDTWRWQGVPFYIRAGKSLPVTCAEVFVRLRRPPVTSPTCGVPATYVRFRISPDTAIALGVTVMDREERLTGEPVELLASRQPGEGGMDAYERPLADAMEGDATLFAREDHVEEAWRIVDPVLREATAPHEYQPGTWGPPAAAEKVAPPGGWLDPSPTG
jgi:glucose-6-phosphate 1-dehydrogenase